MLAHTLACWMLAACGEIAPECTQPSESPEEHGFRVVTYNIGNSRREGPYALRIQDQAYEDYIGERLRSLDADIVFLQEVLTPNQCATFEETDPGQTCYAWRNRSEAAKRILGDEYGLVCDANRQVDCVAVRLSFGRIRSARPNALGLDLAETAKLPGRACDYLAGECDGRSTDCDAESSISTLVVDTSNGAIRLVHVHPTAIGELCRQKQIEQAFSLADDLPTIVAGDWNFDPTRLKDIAASAIWFDRVGQGMRFRSHAGYRDYCRLDRTSVGQNASLDRVVTDFALGRCQVWSAPRLDDGFDFSKLRGRRADHYAVECELGGEPS